MLPPYPGDLHPRRPSPTAPSGLPGSLTSGAVLRGLGAPSHCFHHPKLAVLTQQQRLLGPLPLTRSALCLPHRLVLKPRELLQQAVRGWRQRHSVEGFNG